MNPTDCAFPGLYLAKADRSGSLLFRWTTPTGVAGGTRPCVWRRAILPLQKSCGPRGAELFLSEKDPPPPGWGTLAFESVGALWFERRP